MGVKRHCQLCAAKLFDLQSSSETSWASRKLPGNAYLLSGTWCTLVFTCWVYLFTILAYILHYDNPEGSDWNPLYQFCPRLEKLILWESRAAKMRPWVSLLCLNQAKNLSTKGCEHICMLKICFLCNKLSIPGIDVQMKNWSRSHLPLQPKRTDEAWETIATNLFHCLQKKQLISFCIMQRARSDGRNQSHVSISWHIQRCN